MKNKKLSDKKGCQLQKYSGSKFVPLLSACFCIIRQIKVFQTLVFFLFRYITRHKTVNTLAQYTREVEELVFHTPNSELKSVDKRLGWEIYWKSKKNENEANSQSILKVFSREIWKNPLFAQTVIFWILLIAGNIVFGLFLLTFPEQTKPSESNIPCCSNSYKNQLSIQQNSNISREIEESNTVAVQKTTANNSSSNSTAETTNKTSKERK